MMHVGGIAADIAMAIPPLTPRWAELLCLLSAFLLRLIDRRWTIRSGWRGWTSHIRLKPYRLALWIAAILIGRWPALLTALITELWLYPVLTQTFARVGRGGLLTTMIVAGAIMEGLTRVGCGVDLLRYLTLYASGVMLGIFWLRGPDGEPGAALLAAGGTTLFGTIAISLPVSISWSLPAAASCLLLALAHLATLRRAPLHWRGHGALPVRLGFRRLRHRTVSPPA